MDFENKIKSLANDIYKKVVKFICDNKDNDDVLYDYAYLIINNGKQLMYSFNNEELYVTESNEVGYNMFFSYEAKIDKEGTEYNSKIEYETGLNKQNSLTEKEKTKIIKYYEELNKLVDDLIYNKEKTHNEDNYNYEAFDVYCEYMYKKELSELEESCESILPAVKVAVEWWARILSNKNRGGSIGNDIDSKIFMTCSDMVYSKDSIQNEKIVKFKEVLASKIMEKIYESDEVIQIICDYGPDSLLYDAMIESGIKTTRSPFKTNMYIRAYYVAVREGYGASDVILFDSIKEVDRENIKNICCGNSKDKKEKLLTKNIINDSKNENSKN